MPFDMNVGNILSNLSTTVTTTTTIATTPLLSTPAHPVQCQFSMFFLYDGVPDITTERFPTKKLPSP